ncbi:type II secretion system F family protein [Psychroflexus tropicus]|uniref:type II secretion system F family protein n=1 Tax=Psychroflexus tropicus TaxID=197345 RepID=UPI00035EAC87|nr:type II secretion system F family protein [Psychroflexus tropicus]
MGIKVNQHTSKPTKAKASTDKVESILKKDISFGKAFNSKQKEKFYLEISILINSGVSLIDALNIFKTNTKDKRVKQVLQLVYDRIIAGESFASALEGQKEFSSYECYSIKIGEETGSLSKVSELLAHYYERKNQTKKNITSALTYPIIILSTAGLVVLFMLRYVVPMFEDIFKRQNVELPGITKFIIDISFFLRSYAASILISLMAIIVLLIFLNKKLWFIKARQRLILKLPIINKFIKLIYISQLFQALSMLSTAKLPMFYALELITDMIPFYPLKAILEQIKTDIKKGDSLSESMKKFDGFFEKSTIAMLVVAEETNKTEFIFSKLNEQFEQKVIRQSKTLTTVLEPVIIVLVGFIVGVILVSMYLPMFKLSTVIG